MRRCSRRRILRFLIRVEAVILLPLVVLVLTQGALRERHRHGLTRVRIVAAPIADPRRGLPDQRRPRRGRHRRGDHAAGPR